MGKHWRWWQFQAAVCNMWMRPFLFSLTNGCFAEHMGKKDPAKYGCFWEGAIFWIQILLIITHNDEIWRWSLYSTLFRHINGFFFDILWSMIIFRKTIDFMDQAPLLQDCPELHHWFLPQWYNGSSVNRDFAFIQHCQRSFESLISGCATLTIIHTIINIYMFVEFGTSIRLHVFKQWPDFPGRHRRGVSNPSRYLKVAVEKQSVGLGVVAQMGTLKAKGNIPKRIYCDISWDCAVTIWYDRECCFS